MKIIVAVIWFLVGSAFSLVCEKQFEETVCDNFTFSPEITLDSDTNKLTIKNAKGAITGANLADLKQVTEIKITSSDLDAIETGALCSLPNLTSITLISNNKVPKITRDTLKGCQHLKKVFLGGHEVTIENGAFTEAENLQTVAFNETTLPYILEKAIFQGLEQLKSLTIKYSGICRIEEGAFDNLKNLKFLDLQYNDIDTIPPKTFKDLLELKVLNLADNKLSDLTWDEFEGLKSLKVLFLERNEFREVNVEKLLENVPDLERIFLSHDKLSPDSIKQIEEIFPKLNKTVIYSGVKFV